MGKGSLKSRWITFTFHRKRDHMFGAIGEKKDRVGIVRHLLRP